MSTKLNANITVALLCILSLLNYMDRYTLASVLKDIQSYFGINNTTSGLLQTAFICSFMIFAPVFGFLGDRYSRKWIIIGGVVFSTVVTLLSSFVQPNQIFLFFIGRALVGVGEASYSTVAPTIIADLFTGKRRSTMIAVFYFAVPVGSGLGYIVGSQMSNLFGGWQWALRFTPPFCFIATFCYVFVNEPERGAMDGGAQQKTTNSSSSSSNFKKTIKSFKTDILYLLRVPSYICTTFGFTAVCFSTGAISWWAPYFLTYAIPDSSEENISLVFGIIACLGGFVGVILGAWSSQHFRPKYPSIDPYICGVGVLLSIPCATIALSVARSQPIIAWITIFLSITFLSANWSVVVDILLYVIVPSRRASAQAVQISISHILGDASSPFIVGGISNLISDNSDDPDIEFRSLQYALYLCPAVLVLGGFFFIYGAKFVLKDESRFKSEIAIESVLSSNNSEFSNSEN